MLDQLFLVIKKNKEMRCSQMRLISFFVLVKTTVHVIWRYVNALKRWNIQNSRIIIHNTELL